MPEVDKIALVIPEVMSPAEQRLEYELPFLQDQYGPLFPVINLDGTYDIYDEDGELVATIFEDGELELLCEDVEVAMLEGEPVCEDEPWAYEDGCYVDECDPFAQTCQGDEGNAVKKSGNKFADSSDVFTEPADKLQEEPIVSEGEALSEPMDFQDELEMFEVAQADPAEPPLSDKPAVGGADEPFGSDEGPPLQEGAFGTIVPTLSPPCEECHVEISLGQVLEVVAGVIKDEAVGKTRLVTADKDIPPSRRIARSIWNVTEAVAASLAGFVVQTREEIAPHIFDAFKDIVVRLRRGFFKQGAGRGIILAEAGKDAGGRQADEGSGFASLSRPCAASAPSSDVNVPKAHGAPLFAGAAALHDGNCDPYVIALAHMDKGGPPYFLSLVKPAPAVQAGGHESSHDRVLMARSHGDAHHHHGEQDDDRGGDRHQQQEHEQESELEEGAPALA